jgi:hypothetical protein
MVHPLGFGVSNITLLILLIAQPFSAVKAIPFFDGDPAF